MKWFGLLIVAGYAVVHQAGFDRWPEDDRGTVPADARRGPGGIFMWHGGFMGGK